ncbi:MAG: hypothetical protein ACOC0H_03230 [Thermodesulfobacteriota bacterium]
MDISTRKQGLKQLIIMILATATVALIAVPMAATAQEENEQRYDPGNRFETREDERGRYNSSFRHDDEFYGDKTHGYYEEDEGMFEEEGVFEDEGFEDEGYEEPTFEDWEYGEDYFTDDWFEEQNEFNYWYD